MEELEALNMLPCDAVCLRSAVIVNLTETDVRDRAHTQNHKGVSQ